MKLKKRMVMKLKKRMVMKLKKRMVMKLKYFTLIIFVTLFLVNLVFASEYANLKINKQSFSYKDPLVVSIEVTNKLTHDSEFEVRAVLDSENQGFIPRTILKRITISALGKGELELYNFNIDENFKLGDYRVNADVYYQGSKIGTDSFAFRIINEIKSFNFDIKICKDSSCNEKSNIFLKNQMIYLDYSSDIKYFSTNTILTYPDGKKENINLPTSIKASQIGTYRLDVSASKEGYKTTTKSVQFGVIEKPAEIAAVPAPNINEFKTSSSEKGNEITSKIGTKKGIIIFLSAVGILIIIIAIVLLLLLKKKPSVKSKS